MGNDSIQHDKRKQLKLSEILEYVDLLMPNSI